MIVVPCRANLLSQPRQSLWWPLSSWPVIASLWCSGYATSHTHLTPYSLTQQVNGFEDGGFSRSTLPSELAFLRSSRSPQRMKSLSLRSRSVSWFLRRLILLFTTVSHIYLDVPSSFLDVGEGDDFWTYSTASIFSRCTASFPHTKSLILSLGCPGGGFASSTRRQNRHSQLRRGRWLAFPSMTASPSSSYWLSLSQSDIILYSGLYETAKSSSFGGKKSTTRTVAR